MLIELSKVTLQLGGDGTSGGGTAPGSVVAQSQEVYDPPAETTETFPDNAVTALSLTHTVLVDGNYTIETHVAGGVDGASESIMYNVWVDGVQTDQWYRLKEQVENENDAQWGSCKFDLALTAGEHTFELRYGIEPGGPTQAAQIGSVSMYLSRAVS